MVNEYAVAMVERIESMILTIRGQRVMFDSDLARIYAVSTYRLNEQLRRNRKRFPKDFAFQLTRKEFDNLRSQIAISSSHGGRRYLPWVLTEHGAIMLATVLNSPVAIDASIRVVRAFIFLREQLAANQQLARKLAEMEGRVDIHDEALKELFEAIRQLLEPVAPPQPDREIGFHMGEEAPPYRVRVNRKR